MSITTAVQQFEEAYADALSNLEKSRDGVVYWEAQAGKLAETIKAIKAILPAEDIAQAPPAAPGQKKAAGKPTGTKALEIPATNSEFWMGCLSEKHQKTDEILAVATGKLGVVGDDKIAILRTRQTVFLQKAAKDGKIKSKGERQNRVYFL